MCQAFSVQGVAYAFRAGYILTKHTASKDRAVNLSLIGRKKFMPNIVWNRPGVI